jgi:hypothetical protein
MDFSKIHSCEKSEGKIVLIETDKMGLTHCGYCHEVVDYSQLSLELPARVRDMLYAETVILSYQEYLELEMEFFRMKVAFHNLEEKFRTIKEKYGGRK